MSSPVSSVTNNTVANPATGTDAFASAASQTLSEQDFLNLLVTQMTSQDPMNPMTNQDMLSQMVQFSTLQGNTSMQSTLADVRSHQVFSDANSLIGKQVNLLTDASGDTAQGVVSGVDVSSGTPQIVVNGHSYDLAKVLTITPAATTNP